MSIYCINIVINYNVAQLFFVVLFLLFIAFLINALHLPFGVCFSSLLSCILSVSEDAAE